MVISTFLEAKIDSDDAKYTTKNNNNNNTIGIPMKETSKNGDTQITVLSSEYSGKGFKDALDIMKESEVTNSGRKCPSEQSESKDEREGGRESLIDSEISFRYLDEIPPVLQFDIQWKGDHVSQNTVQGEWTKRFANFY